MIFYHSTQEGASMIKVLIVDDEKAMLDGLTKYIRWADLGVDGVIAASNPIEAIPLAEKEKPDILLADIKMPEMDGVEMGKIIRKKLPECSIIFLTAYSEKEYLKSAILLRAVNFLEKPVNRAELSNVISELVKEIKQRKEKGESSAYDAAVSFSEEIALKLTAVITQERYEQLVKQYNLYEYEGKSVACACIKLSVNDCEEPVLKLDTKNKTLIGLKNLFEEESFSVFAALKDSDQFVVFIFGEFSLKQIFNSEKIYALKEALSEYHSKKVDVFIGVGNIKKGLRGCSDTYQEAVAASQRCFFVGYGKVMFYKGVSAEEVTFDHIASEFESTLKQCDKSKAIEFVCSTADMLRKDDNLTISSVKNLFYGMLFRLFEFASSYALKGDFSKNQLWDKISGIKSLDSLTGYMTEQIECVMPQISDSDIIIKNVHNIMEFVEKNYRNPELSLEMIARGVYLSPQYICKIFKEKTGKTVNTFMIESRIEEAKLLLRDNGEKLADIASMVGYKSPNHFAKVFNKYTGVNPSDYRRRFLKHI